MKFSTFVEKWKNMDPTKITVKEVQYTIVSTRMKTIRPTQSF